MGSYTVQPNQSFYDIVLNACGTLEAAMAVAAANDMPVTELLRVGQVIIIPDGLAVDNGVLRYLSTEGIVIATANITLADGMEAESGEYLESEDGDMLVREDV